MSINIGVIDAQATRLATDLSPEFELRLGIKNDPIKQRSLSFVFMVVRALLDLTDDEALDCLTEGGNDFGVDAIHVGDIEDGEFQVTLFQGKYTNNATGANTFPQTGIEKAVQAVRYLFDPNATVTTNPVLKARVEDIRSQVRDGNIPRVCAVMCSNGSPWNAAAQQVIDQAGFPAEQVAWKYVNHDDIVRLMQATKQVDDTLRLSGKAMVEDFDYRRVLVGKIPVKEIEALFSRHGDLLLDRNIRRFLGLQGNRVNTGIAATLNNQPERPNFYFYNNGITLLCKKFFYNALQASDHQVKAHGLQIINGGQTCKTIQSTLSALVGATPDIEKAFVLVRLYELPEDSDDLVRSITYATNSQSPVDLRDLRSNDARQKNLETDIAGLTDAAGRKWIYVRNRSNAGLSRQHILSSRAAESVLAVWRSMPHQAKTHSRELFSNLIYDSIFTAQLNGAQLILATLMFRFAETKRQQNSAVSPDWITYASHFVAMLMGRYLLTDLGITLDQLNHAKFTDAIKQWELKDEQYHAKALGDLQTAINNQYGNQPQSLQQLAATFRRGDLLQPGRLP
ncbi:AIPR family protein [Singulisphaera rosea]